MPCEVAGFTAVVAKILGSTVIEMWAFIAEMSWVSAVKACALWVLPGWAVAREVSQPPAVVAHVELHGGVQGWTMIYVVGLFTAMITPAVLLGVLVRMLMRTICFRMSGFAASVAVGDPLGAFGCP